MLSASLPVSVSYHIRGCLLNVLWQHFQLGGWDILLSIAPCLNAQLISIEHHRRFFTHTAWALTGWPGSCHISHHISIHHCHSPDRTGKIQQSECLCVFECMDPSVCPCVCLWPDGTSWINGVWVIPRGVYRIGHLSRIPAARLSLLSHLTSVSLRPPMNRFTHTVQNACGLWLD